MRFTQPGAITLISGRDEQLVVRSYSEQKQRVRRWIQAACLVVVFVAGYLLGGQYFGNEMAAKRELEKAFANLESENRTIKQQLMVGEVAVEVDKAALENVRKTVVELQNQIAQSQEELELYRKLMRDDSLPEGLSIRQLSLTQSAEGGVSYRLVVQNKTSKLKSMDVNIQVSVEGELEGNPKTIELHELDEKLTESPLRMTFKYFGVAQGVIQLPEGFLPRLVHVSLWKKTRAKQEQKLFDWHIEDE